MNYSTLQEAYNIDTFEKKTRPSHKQNKNGGATQVNANTPSSMNTSPSYVESSKLAASSNKIEGSCSPLQAPAYNIPISNDCKKEHSDAMNVYIDGGANNGNSGNSGNNGNSGNTNPTAQMTSMFNLKNSGGDNRNNVMPFYDEDLEQYFNINNLNDEVKYNSNSYMPNSNKQSYTNNDTGEYTNNNTMLKNGNNLLNNPGYNLTPEEKKNAEDAIAYLKSIEEKITRNSIADPVMPPANTGPGGFKSPIATATTATTATTSTALVPLSSVPSTPTTSTQLVVIPAKTEKEKSDNYIYNAIFNISILLIVGIAIILLCDLMVELSIQIGMKRTVYILEPFINTQTTV